MASVDEIKALLKEQEDRLRAVLSSSIDSKIDAAIKPVVSL